MFFVLKQGFCCDIISFKRGDILNERKVKEYAVLDENSPVIEKIFKQADEWMR